MRSYFRTLGALVVFTGATQAHAQGPWAYDWERPVQGYIDGGYAATTGRTGNYLDDGWTIGTGLHIRPMPGSPFSIRVGLQYSQFNATNQLISLGEQQNQTQIDHGTGRIVGLDADGVLDIPLGRGVRAYLMAGVGGAYRQIDLTQRVGFGGSFCDRWFGLCGGEFFPGQVLVDREESTRFAWNAGLGIEFSLYNGQSWFVEARYDKVNTDLPTEFVPIRVGLRF